MRKVALCALLALVAAPGCGNLLDPAAAVVYGEKIPIDAVQDQLDRYVQSRGFEQLAAQGDSGALKRQFEQGRLSEIIMRRVLTPAAEDRGIDIGDDDVEEQIDQIVDAQFEGNQSAFEEAMKEQGITRPQFEDVIYGQLLNDALRAEVAGDVEPGEAELMEHYEEHEAEFTLRRAQHILVKKHALASQLAARLQSAPASGVDELFEKLAREHSIDPGSAAQGGDLGFQPPGVYVEPFENALDSLDVGEISDPVQSEHGWHVIRVTARRVAPFEEVRARIESELVPQAQDEAWRDFLLALFEEADVEVNPRYGEFDEEQLQVVDPGADDVPGAEEGAPEPSVPGLPVRSPG